MIKLNEQELTKLLTESIKKELKKKGIIKEAISLGSIALSPDYQNSLDRLEDMYAKLKGFISEFQIFSKSLINNAYKAGLKLVSFDGDNSFSIEDALNGYSYDFEYRFIVTNHYDSDEELEKLLRNAYQELMYMLGKPSFGKLDVYDDGEYLIVKYSFSF